MGDVPNTQALTPVERLRIMAFHLGPAEHDELLGIAAEIEAASVTGEHPSDDLIRFMQRVQLEAWPATEADVPLFTEERLIDRIRELAQGTELDRLRNENEALQHIVDTAEAWSNEPELADAFALLEALRGESWTSPSPDTLAAMNERGFLLTPRDAAVIADRLIAEAVAEARQATLTEAAAIADEVYAESVHVIDSEWAADRIGDRIRALASDGSRSAGAAKDQVASSETATPQENP